MMSPQGDGVDVALGELISDTSFVSGTSPGAGAQIAQADVNPPTAVPIENVTPSRTGPARFRMSSQDSQDQGRPRGFSPYARAGPRGPSPARPAMPSGFNPVRLPRPDAQQDQLRQALRYRAMQSDGPPLAEARAPAAAAAQATAVQEAASSLGSARVLAFMQAHAASQAQRDQHIAQQIAASNAQRDEALHGQLQLMQQALTAQHRDAITQGQAIDAEARSVVQNVAAQQQHTRSADEERVSDIASQLVQRVNALEARLHEAERACQHQNTIVEAAPCSAPIPTRQLQRPAR